MLKIARNVYFMPRTEWGARTDLPRLGVIYPPDEPTEAIGHHTVIIDKDATPNRWESVSKVIVKMRQLQTIRPDLGNDIPYSYVAFLMQYANSIGLILCEGRGPYRRQAATMYHNRTGRTIAIEGNTEIGLPLNPYLQHLSYAWGWIKDEYGLVNLGTVTPSRGGIVFGHKDFRQEADRRTWTVCPGKGLMKVIDQITLSPYSVQKEELMLKLFHIKAPRDFFRVCLSNGVNQIYVFNGSTLKERQDAGELPTEVHAVLTGQEAIDFLDRPSGGELL